LSRREASLTATGDSRGIDRDDDVVEHGCTGWRKLFIVRIREGRTDGREDHDLSKTHPIYIRPGSVTETVP
jgi:hypothetical protein